MVQLSGSSIFSLLETMVPVVKPFRLISGSLTISSKSEPRNKAPNPNKKDENLPMDIYSIK